MRGIDTACALYFYRSNLGLIFPEMNINEKTYKEIFEINAVSENINKKIIEIASNNKIKVGSQTEYTLFGEKIIEIAFLTIGEDIEDIDYVLRPIYIEIGSLGLERPILKINAFYHPPVKVNIEGIKGWIIPQGTNLKEEKDLGVRTKIYINIYKIDFNTIRKITGTMIKYALWENALSKPSNKAIENYTEKIMRTLSKREHTKILTGIKEMSGKILDRIRIINRDLEKEAGDHLKRAQEILDYIQYIIS